MTSTNKPSPSERRAFANQIAMELGKTPIQFDTPIPQPLYHFSNGEWVPASPPPTNNSNPPAQPGENGTQIRLTTWNIDFQAPAKWTRMKGALEYLSRLLSPSSTSTSTSTSKDKDDDSDIPSIIFLQEMVYASLIQIQEAPWIRQRFFITDLSDDHWKGAYGTTTLIDKRLAVQRVFRVLFSMSNMQRDGLFVDIGVGTAVQDKTIRFCNTHLESLVSNPPRRPLQLKLLSEYMHGSGPSTSATTTENAETVALPSPHAAFLAGDLNAVGPEDLTAPVDCNLHDAFLTLGGKDGTEESFTWGQQVQELLRETYGCSRMDKVLYCGKVEVKGFRKIGEGEEVWVQYPKWDSDIEEDEEDIDDGENIWVTDHLGLQAVLRVLDS